MLDVNVKIIIVVILIYFPETQTFGRTFLIYFLLVLLLVFTLFPFSERLRQQRLLKCQQTSKINLMDL